MSRVESSPQAPEPAARSASEGHSVRNWPLFGIPLALLWGACLIALLYQLPAQHVVDIGGYDAAYVQGFYDPETQNAAAPAYLQGSDGAARWSRARSYLLFPQAGLPAEVSLRLRGWRASGPPPNVRVLLNSRTVLADFEASGSWQQIDLPIRGGLTKASDVVIEIQTTTTTLPGEARQVGVLLDQATYRVERGAGGFIVPYPTQVLAGAVIVLLSWLLFTGFPTTRRAPRQALVGTLGISLLVGCAFLWLTRMQPPLYPYPLRWLLPAIAGLLAAGLALQQLPAWLARRAVLLDGLALVGVAGWSGLLLLAANDHLTLSVPGVEKDFRVFATRTGSLDDVFKADGFYNLGYPLLLWLVQPLTEHNAFLAARLIAACSGALLLLAGWWLARTLLADQQGYMRVGALLALLVLACSPLVVQYALYVGSDMPFAALVALALALAAAGLRARLTTTRRATWLLVLAGAAAGGAFLVRHLGLVLAGWGVLVGALLVWRFPAQEQPAGRGRLAAALLAVLAFVGGFGLIAAPQLVVNTLETGQPLYSQQAKNIWLGVYGNIDWGRWNEVPNSIGMTELLLRDPPRFVGNWWHNMVAFSGTGAEDTSETGRAVQLRLLAWPANWLAVAGLLGWLWAALRQRGQPVAALRGGLLLFVVLYTAGVSLAFVLLRFFLPLTPIYAVAAAWIVGLLLAHATPAAAGTVEQRLRWQIGAVLLLLALLAGGIGTGTRYVLERQPADEVAMLHLALETLQPGEAVLTNLPAEVPVAKYSALAHRTIPWPEEGVPPSEPQQVVAQARQQGAAYLLWHSAMGEPPGLQPAAAQVGAAGPYRLYRLAAPDSSTGRPDQPAGELSP